MYVIIYNAFVDTWLYCGLKGCTTNLQEAKIYKTLKDAEKEIVSFHPIFSAKIVSLEIDIKNWSDMEGRVDRS